MLLVIFVFQYCQAAEATELFSENGGDGFFRKYAIDVNQIKLPLIWVLIIGSMPFWNVLLSVMCIAVLGAFALVHYKNRNVFAGLLLTAFVSALIVYPQSFAFQIGRFDFSRLSDSAFWLCCVRTVINRIYSLLFARLGTQTHFSARCASARRMAVEIVFFDFPDSFCPRQYFAARNCSLRQ